MVIGMIVDNEFTGDPRVNNEATLLVNEGHKVKVLCFTFGTQPIYEKINGIEVFRIPIRKSIKNAAFALVNTIPFYHWFWQIHIERFIKQQGIERIHAHDLYMALSAGKAAKRFGIKLIVDLHENYPEAILNYKWANSFPKRLVVKPHKWKKNEGRFLRYAHKIITLSPSFANELTSRYPYLEQSMLVVYPNVPNLDELLSYPITPNIFPKNDKFILFYFGGISERRGIYTCINALKIALKKHHNIHLLLIGPVDGPEIERFNKEISAPEVENSITHYPWKDISLLPSYIAISDICLSPIEKNKQHEAGIANKVFQYLLFERPIVVSNCKPQADVVQQGQCGLVFESNNEQSLAQCILELYSNTTKRAEMGASGKKLVLDEYNLSKFKGALTQLYN